MSVVRLPAVASPSPHVQHRAITRRRPLPEPNRHLKGVEEDRPAASRGLNCACTRLPLARRSPAPAAHHSGRATCESRPRAGAPARGYGLRMIGSADSNAICARPGCAAVRREPCRGRSSSPEPSPRGVGRPAPPRGSAARLSTRSSLVGPPGRPPLRARRRRLRRAWTVAAARRPGVPLGVPGADLLRRRAPPASGAVRHRAPPW